MFVGRSKELRILNDLYKSDKFELVIITGRKRIGKSTLLTKFIKDKSGIFFNAVEGNEALNLDLLSQSIIKFEDFKHPVTFTSYVTALESLFELSTKERFIFIIDEYPYLVNAYKPISSILQSLIDKYKDRSKMMLILSGSSISFMENEVLAYKAPLFGRMTAQLRIQPLSFQESLSYFPDNPNQEKIIYYGIYGGTPYYLNQIDSKKTLEANLKQTFFNSSSFLSEEPSNLLKQEVNDVSSYYSVLTAIAGGATRLSEISSKTKLESSPCSRITKNLEELGLIIKELPYNTRGNKKTLYKLSDNAFKFWFRFIPSNLSLIQMDLPDNVYSRIEPYLSDYIGSIFEDISKEYLWTILKLAESPIHFRSLGRWWGANPKTKEQIEIDIMGEEDSDKALFAECKWKNEKTGLKVLKDLIEKSQIFPHMFKEYYLFSKSGFTTELVEMAKQMSNVYLITLDQMISLFERSNKDS